MGCHGLINHGAHAKNIHVPNPFQWVLQGIVDIENVGIGNRETRPYRGIKVMGYYNSKEELIQLFERHALKTCFQYRVPQSDTKR